MPDGFRRGDLNGTFFRTLATAGPFVFRKDGYLSTPCASRAPISPESFGTSLSPLNGHADPDGDHVRDTVQYVYLRSPRVDATCGRRHYPIIPGVLAAGLPIGLRATTERSRTPRGPSLVDHGVPAGLVVDSPGLRGPSPPTPRTLTPKSQANEPTPPPPPSLQDLSEAREGGAEAVGGVRARLAPPHSPRRLAPVHVASVVNINTGARESRSGSAPADILPARTARRSNAIPYGGDRPGRQP